MNNCRADARQRQLLQRIRRAGEVIAVKREEGVCSCDQFITRGAKGEGNPKDEFRYSAPLCLCGSFCFFQTSPRTSSTRDILPLPVPASVLPLPLPTTLQRANSGRRTVGMRSDTAAGHVRTGPRSGCGDGSRRLGRPIGRRKRPEGGAPEAGAPGHNGFAHAAMERTTESSLSQNLFAMPLTWS